MTPNEQLEKLRKDYLKDIELFFQEKNLKSINFHPVKNDLGVDFSILDDKGLVTVLDESGNDEEIIISELNVEAIGHMLTLIQTSAYDISED